jgi:hypothetical protein
MHKKLSRGREEDTEGGRDLEGRPEGNDCLGVAQHLTTVPQDERRLDTARTQKHRLKPNLWA